jgi:TfoX/Sxy family transcriptional regulator of competence genes
MAYDEQLAARVRALLAGERQVAEKAMFGRRMFMVAGNLAVGVAGDELMVRVGAQARHKALSQPGARACDLSGRPMFDWVLVGVDGLGSERELEVWVQRGLLFARTLVKT